MNNDDVQILTKLDAGYVFAAGSTSSRTGVLLTTSLVSALIVLDANIVAVSLPAIAQTFEASFSNMQWVISSYLLSHTGLLLGAGSYADLSGRKKATVIGLAVFGIASIGCGCATSLLMLNLARVVQGVGASMLLTAALAIISRTFTGAERSRAFAVCGACLGVALTGAPLIGGMITAFLGWRWIFLINIPICVWLIAASLRYLSESRDEDAILNAETVKVIGAAVSPERAGMASGIASTSRFVGILLGVAGLGAILADVSNRQLLSLAKMDGLNPSMAAAVIRQATSGNFMEALPGISENLQKQLHAAASDAFASGFAVVGVVAAALAGGACIAAFGLIRSSETAPAGGTTNRLCKMADRPIP